MSERKRQTFTQTFLEHGKIPPQCIDIEETVLGSILLDGNSIDKVINILRPNTFYKEAHHLIFQGMIDLMSESKPIDLMMLTNQLKINGTLELCGGPYLLSQLASRVPVSAIANIQYHSYVLTQKYLQREIIRICSEGIDKAFEDGEDADPDIIINELEKLHEVFTSVETVDFKNAVAETIKDIANKAYGKVVTNYLTGNNNYDRIVGITPTNILFIVGEAGSYKTKFVAFLMRCLLQKNKDKVAIKWFSFEDPVKKMIRLFLSQTVYLEDRELQSKDLKLNQSTLEKIEKASKEFNGYDIEFVDEPQPVKTIKRKFIAFCKERTDKLNILIIDNLALLPDNDKVGDNARKTQTEIDDQIARDIKSIETYLKNNYNVLIIVLHHLVGEYLDKLNLKTGYRATKKMIRGSSRLPEIATQVAIINCPSLHNDLVNEYDEIPEVMKHLWILDVVKNRNDKLGVIHWFTEPKYTIFEEI